jgi:hypothetical protein
MNAITTHTAEPAMMGFLQRAISDPGFDTAKFEVVLAAVREEQAKHAERAFYAAMAEAQGEMEPIRKDAINPHTKSRYASFEAIDGTLRPVYTRHGFSVSYRTGKTDQPGVVRMICTVAHAGGHSIEAELTAALDNSGAGGRTNKTDVQAVGSTVSYLRRYILSMIWNVALAGDDDDGESSRKQQASPLRAEAERAYPKRRMDPVQSMDEVLKGDRIPDFDAPPPVDKAAVGVQALEAQIRAATSEDELHAIAGSPQVEKQRAWLAKHRPELEEIVAGALGERYQEIVQAKLEAEGAAAEAVA